jgi:lipid II:glycine glycyltransferase (peptidoglycan interpeptide bridge formation enzyme)
MNSADWCEEWAAWLSGQGLQAGFGQSPTWARLRGISQGAKAYLIGVKENGRRVAGALLLHCKPQPRDHFMLRASKIGVVECLGGPVLPVDATPEQLAELLDRIEALVIQLRASHLSFVARPPAAIWSDRLSEVFAARGYRQTSVCTSLIDLTPDMDAMFAGFDPAARKGVRKCEKRGLLITECKDWTSYYTEFLLPFYSSVGHEALTSRGEETERMIWDEQARSGLYRFFVARTEGGPVLATLGTHTFNGLATEIASGRTQEGLKSDLPAQDLLHWHAFGVHKSAGDLMFDMAGFSATPSSPKEAGIKRFKEKWGGRTVEIPSYHRDFPTLANAVVAAGGRVKRLIRLRAK